MIIKKVEVPEDDMKVFPILRYGFRFIWVCMK